MLGQGRAVAIVRVKAWQIPRRNDASSRISVPLKYRMGDVVLWYLRTWFFTIRRVTKQKRFKFWYLE